MKHEMKTMEEMFGQKEPLRHGLRQYIVKGKKGEESVFHHPLYIWDPYNESFNALINRSIKAKEDVMIKSLEEKNYWRYVYTHERPYRLGAFLKISDHLSLKEYWKLFVDIWTDSENIFELYSIWKRLLVKGGKNTRLMMTDEESSILDEMPEEIEIYRGHNDWDKEGLSWTTELTTAKFFANRKRCRGPSMVTKRKIRKNDVLALTMERSENEIIALPESTY